MEKITKDIENRPKELWDLPNYGCLPNGLFNIDLEGSVGQFLFHDIFDLDGTQPIENKIMGLSTKLYNNLPVIELNPSKEAIEFYEKRGDDFQMISVVVCCYAFEEKDGIFTGLPYHISLRPAQKRGLPSSVNTKWIEQIDLSAVLDGSPHYMGYNPFSNAFGFYCLGPVQPNKNICSDTIGFIYKTYFLASKYDKQDVCDPGMCTSLIGESKLILNDYRKFRFNRYFKPFENIEPIKIWGCDSPIELFLLQAMNSLKLRPKIQMHIFKDGSSFPSLQAMWEDGRRTKTLARTITEADFFFEEQKIAVFCDSVAHHSSQVEIARDLAIDESLKKIGIRSIRISGPDIVRSPLECAKRVEKMINMNI
ncbi:very short patch repair endonuclease [Yersinia intermedia]|uniref:very short patch repair endonuclease n=1 Tax=Yersinia intermedia TaxID=631 RepID=UPI001CFD654D|nr:very short patch repair endonuclease [Yersinia intermedia]MCB5300558.1 very short patch repair endonuclease [Yersinia intermedia]